MTRIKRFEIDDRLAETLSGRDKVRALMSAKSNSVSRWAVDRGFIPEQVFMCTAGQRTYPEIRDVIAADFGISREEVDQLLEPEATAAVG